MMNIRTNPPVVPRFLQIEAAHHCAVFIAHARLAEPAVHQRRHEPVRARFFSARPNAPTRRAAPPTPRNASAPAASTTTSKTSASTPITTRFSRCSATGASAIISRRKPSRGRGNSWWSIGNFLPAAFTPRSSVLTSANPVGNRNGRPISKSPKAAWPQSRTQSTEEAATYDESTADIDAIRFWMQQFQHARLDPRVHIVPGSKKDNFWMMGETGPCGPCSELHVDLTPAGDTKGALVNKGDARCIEIWNLVFIQFNANPDGTFSPLPAKHVDTGMGFERVASIIQGTQKFTDFANARISNYETDIFRPIFDAIEKLSGKKYGHLPERVAAVRTIQKQLARRRRPGRKSIDIAFRVIADHIRTLQFCDCRRHPARQQRPQLRPAPHPAPRRALRPHARLQGTVLLQTRGRAGRHDGRRLPRNPRQARSKCRKPSSARKRRLTGRWIKELNLFESH